VGITSVGAGSIIMVSLLLLYPGMKAVDMVSTDLTQAVPLVISAAASHVITSGVQWSIFVPLLVGSTAGTFLGSRIAYEVSEGLIRRALTVILIVSGSAMLGVPPVTAVIIGLAAPVVGVPLLKLSLNGKRRQLAHEPEV